jgi:maltooligosyltrehalose trehalohydrolase
MTVRQHRMPFGAECQSDGAVRFRLWAPAATRIDLVLESVTLPVPQVEPGWFELTTDRASAGSLYRYLVNGKASVPDPASRFQPEDVRGPSRVVDPAAFPWKDDDWRGRPWEDAVIYELHVGAFSGAGTFKGVQEKLEHLSRLGITTIELLPLSDFFGKRNWGYDGVLPFAPDSSYGEPDDLKRLIEAAHKQGLMMLLDVVYNHFGPEGNYLREYAPQFFTSRHHTPWGEGINFDGEQSRTVRDFFIHNALYWLEEFHFDGLRLDAVHSIQDDSTPNFLTELASTVRKTFGSKRHIHLVLENDDNAARYLKGDVLYDAQWNDDIHHACHVVISGEKDGYFVDYADKPISALGKCLTEGFFFQGQPSGFRGGKARGEVSSGLPLSCFVSFLQNHDQVGNRAFGERISQYADARAVRAAMAILLLAPSPPLIFMGEEFGASTPFLYFCDFEAGVATAVTEGRRAEFAKFAQYSNPEMRETIPDPNAEATFIASKLDWASIEQPQHAEWLSFYCRLLALRQEKIVPLLRQRSTSVKATFCSLDDAGLVAQWKFGDRTLHLVANLSGMSIGIQQPVTGQIVFTTSKDAPKNEMQPWSVAWYLRR